MHLFNFCISIKYMNMNQFTQLLILIFIASSLHLSASDFNKTDTIGKFHEVTDIELRIKKISDENVLPQLKECIFKVACDVTNPYIGPNGATYVFGPQKGANKEE